MFSICDPGHGIIQRYNNFFESLGREREGIKCFIQLEQKCLRSFQFFLL